VRRRRYQQHWRDPQPDSVAWVGARADSSGKLPEAMFLLGNALGYTLSLLAVFGGIGILANVMIFYVVAQVLGERKENQERRERGRG